MKIRVLQTWVMIRVAELEEKFKSSTILSKLDDLALSIRLRYGEVTGADFQVDGVRMEKDIVTGLKCNVRFGIAMLDCQEFTDSSLTHHDGKES